MGRSLGSRCSASLVMKLSDFVRIIIHIMEPPNVYRLVVTSPQTKAIFDFWRLSFSFQAKKKPISSESCETYRERNFRLSMWPSSFPFKD